MALPRASSSDRIRELKEERRRRTKIRIAIAVVSVLVIVGSLVFISRTPQLQIQTVVVRGNYIVSTDDVKATVSHILAEKYFWLFPKTNVFLYPSAYITKTIQSKFPRFETINVHRENWNTIVVDVAERKNTYLWCDMLPADALAENESSNCYYVDGHGYIFSQSPTFSGNVYFVFFGTYGWNEGDSPIGKRILTEDTFKDVIRFKEGLESKQLAPYGFIAYSTGVYSFLLNSSLDDSRQKVVFTDTEDIPTLYDNLVSALGSNDLLNKLTKDFANLEYLDLRYENKVYYKFSDMAN